MIYSYVNTKEETNVESDARLESEILFNSEEYVTEDVLLKGKDAKGSKEASKLGNLIIEVDKGVTDYKFSKNNAYFKAIKDGKIIRLNLANTGYQVHKDPVYAPWEKTINKSDLDDINLALGLKCTSGRFKGMIVYDAAVEMYKEFYHIDLGISVDDRPKYKTSNIYPSKSEHEKKGK